jgi:preprotein translocase subunit SecE
MSQAGSTAFDDDREAKERAPARPAPRPGQGFFRYYKREQGKWTRLGTFIGLSAIVAWGAFFVYDRLRIYEGDEAWRIWITTGIPLAVLGLFVAFSWWISYSGRASSDFMIATEGEMKKVSWSTKREIIGSTKVVIMFTVLLAMILFVVDFLFQMLFASIGVLKTA